MKKIAITIVALMGATGIGIAAEIAPLTDSQSGTWTHDNNNTIANGVLSGNPNWQVDCSTYTLTNALTINTDEILNFSDSGKIILALGNSFEMLGENEI